MIMIAVFFGNPVGNQNEIFKKPITLLYHLNKEISLGVLIFFLESCLDFSFFQFLCWLLSLKPYFLLNSGCSLGSPRM